MELLEGVCHPLNKEIYLLEWLKKKTNKIKFLTATWNQLDFKTSPVDAEWFYFISALHELNKKKLNCI